MKRALEISTRSRKKCARKLIGVIELLAGASSSSCVSDSIGVHLNPREWAFDTDFLLVIVEFN